MNCTDLEILLCDYVDGMLRGEEKALVETHLAECPACAELARDAGSAVAFMGLAANVEPPAELPPGGPRLRASGAEEIMRPRCLPLRGNVIAGRELDVGRVSSREKAG